LFFRDEWGKIYQAFFTSGRNRKAIDTLEKAAFVVVLEEESAHYSKEDSTELNKMGHSLLHGTGWNRWFDKSICAVVYSNGKIGFNLEHSWADAPIVGQMLENVFVDELVANRFTSDGHCVGTATSDLLKFPERLDWDLNEELVDTIERAADDAEKRIKDLQLQVMVHDTFGKGAIKKCGVGPDGFIQMAIQLAFYREHKQFCLTYEASMMRLFRDGRTETVRPVTQQSCAFVKAMCNPEISRQDRQKLLRCACDNHQRVAKNAMVGKGMLSIAIILYPAKLR
jgi:hypothetical protein